MTEYSESEIEELRDYYIAKLDQADNLYQMAGAEMNRLRDKIGQMQGVLEAMRATVYEQPIGCWFGAIDAALGTKPQRPKDISEKTPA